MENVEQPLMTLEELCDALMIGKNAAYRLLIEGKIKAFRIGRIWKIPRSSLMEYLRSKVTD